MKGTATKRSVLAALLCLPVLLISANVFAAAPVASVAGPASIRAGSTLTVTFYVNGTGIDAVQGEIRYDASQLTYKSSSGVLKNWVCTPDGATAGKVTFLGYDDTAESPIDGKMQLFKLSFTVKSSVASGSTITVTATQLTATDGTDDFTPSDASCSVLVAAAPTAGPTSAATPTLEPTAEPTATPTTAPTDAPTDAPSPSPEATTTSAPTPTPSPTPGATTPSVPIWLTAVIALACGGAGFLLGARSGNRRSA